MENDERIELDHGGGGYKSWQLLQEVRGILKSRGDWQNCEDDAAVYDLSHLVIPAPDRVEGKAPAACLPARQGIQSKLVFTSDGFIVDPIFFPGGDIGKIAMCGTINDLSVMGAKPLGISLSIVIEEGFPKKDLLKIIGSINKVSEESGVPVVTGDTKVTPKGKLDKIEITTSGVGITDKIIPNNGINPGDVIITSGDLGEHSVTLLASRFNYKTKLQTDSKPLNKDIEKVKDYLNACKDPTRGGLAANIVEMAEKSKVKIILDETTLPYKKEVIAVSELLGIDIFSLASEGRFIAAVSPDDKGQALAILRKFNPEAKIIGRAEKGSGVYLKTKLSALRPIEMPKGKLIPRIC